VACELGQAVGVWACGPVGVRPVRVAPLRGPCCHAVGARATVTSLSVNPPAPSVCPRPSPCVCAACACVCCVRCMHVHWLASMLGPGWKRHTTTHPEGEVWEAPPKPPPPPRPPLAPGIGEQVGTTTVTRTCGLAKAVRASRTVLNDWVRPREELDQELPFGLQGDAPNLDQRLRSLIDKDVLALGAITQCGSRFLERWLRMLATGAAPLPPPPSPRRWGWRGRWRVLNPLRWQLGRQLWRQLGRQLWRRPRGRARPGSCLRRVLAREL
jgi:hypothetical protein